ncbi:MAG: phosphotransferase family protein [Pigmentiphaga sp.]|nr:phosphotransferase family protein [Pigmentiphaga sp.]
MNTQPAAPALSDSSTLRLLQAWLEAHVPHFTGLDAIERIEGGQSNPTWILRGRGGAWVLRAKPGPATTLLPSAHAIEREFRIMRALRDSVVPVPRVHALCDDEALIGAAFYVMDYVEGRVLRDVHMPAIPLAQRAAYHAEANRVLAGLHGLDWRAAGLSGFGREQGFFQRLIQRWGRQYRNSIATPIAAMENLSVWLPEHLPAGADDPRHTRLTHGDFRFENLMFHPAEPRIVAVLDWELSTLGHPLSDLAYHCLAWHLPAGILRGYGLAPQAHGIPREHDYLRAYCTHTGRELAAVLADWPFYLAFNLFRLAAILQGVAHRQTQGLSANSQAAAIGRMAGPVAELGWSIARGSGAAPGRSPSSSLSSNA